MLCICLSTLHPLALRGETEEMTTNDAAPTVLH